MWQALSFWLVSADLPTIWASAGSCMPHVCAPILTPCTSLCLRNIASFPTLMSRFGMNMVSCGGAHWSWPTVLFHTITRNLSQRMMSATGEALHQLSVGLCRLRQLLQRDEEGGGEVSSEEAPTGGGEQTHRGGGQGVRAANTRRRPFCSGRQRFGRPALG